MDNKPKLSVMKSIFLYGFNFGLIAGIIEGVSILLQSILASPVRVTGDTLQSILNIFFLSIIGNIAFITLMNLTLGLALYLLAKKLANTLSSYVFVFISGFFMAFNILINVFTANYYITQLIYPLPAFIVLRTIFYSILASLGTILLYRFFVQKWGYEKAVRIFMSLVFILILAIPSLLIINRVYIPFSASLKSAMINIAFFAVFFVLFLFIAWFYKVLSGKYPHTFAVKNPVIPVLVMILLLLPFIFSGVKDSGEELKAPLGGDKPNVLLISIDTLRADALSCYGNDAVNTKNIDKLAEEGILFENAYSQSPWTLTSIASFMTGLYPSVNGLNLPLLRLDSNRETLAEVFRRGGYNTVGVITNGWNKQNFGMDLGFERYNFQGDSMWIMSFNNSLWFRTLLFSSSRVLKKPILYRTRFPNQASSVSDVALEMLDLYKDTNFFMWVHYIDPHDPYSPPREYIQKLTKGYSGRYMGSSGRINTLRQGVMISEADKNQILNLYYGEVEYTDREIGRILDTLKEYDLYDNTIVVVISDHGEEFWEHSSVAHGHNLYWHQLHVPFVLKWKEQIEPAVITERVALLDLKPTLLTLCGLEAEEIMQGIDLSPVIFNSDEELSERLEQRDLYAEALIYFEEMKSVSDGVYKYVYSEVSHKEELYDLAIDPLQQYNIIASRDEEAQKYRDMLNEWLNASELLNEALPKDESDTKAHLDEETLQQLRALGYIN